MELSEIMKHPHIEVNEDGRAMSHPGYEIRKCKTCGSQFICAITSIALCCGDYKRDKGALIE